MTNRFDGPINGPYGLPSGFNVQNGLITDRYIPTGRSVDSNGVIRENYAPTDFSLDSANRVKGLTGLLVNPDKVFK